LIAEALLLLAAAGALTVAGCRSAPAARRDVRIAGSDTMLPLNRRLAEEYMREHPGVAVRVAGGSTGRGVDALLTEEVDLCAASRPLTPDEIRRLHDRFDTIGLRFLMARDALSVYVHPSNTVRSLTVAQLAAVFSGAVDNWSSVGGEDAPIEPVVRTPSSGTHHFFRDHVLQGEAYATTALYAVRPRDVIDLVGAHPSAIGYGGLAHGPGVVQLRVDGVAATTETVRDGSYPLARYLYFYATEPPLGETKSFVDWCVGVRGQRVVDEAGFVPLWPDR
jgi:phosphate transport system substrate-binding protein